MGLLDVCLDESKLNKREQLAKLLSVAPSRLEAMADTTCTRLINAIRKCPHYIESYGVTYMALMRTVGVGRSSAVSLCQALGIECKYFPTKSLVDQRLLPEDVAGEIAKFIMRDTTSDILSTSAHAVGSSKIVVVGVGGEKFGVTVHRL